MLVTHTLPNTHSVTISANFRVGSLYENNSNNGITHLVEHLFFRRLSDIPQTELYLRMQSIGTELRGATFNDYVSFTVTVVPEFFTEAFEFICCLYDEFEWTDNEIQLEKNVVLRQIENKYISYNEWCDGCYLQNTGYSLPIIGTAENITNLKNHEINQWKNKFFTASNSCVVITGNVSEQDIISATQKLENLKSGFVQAPIISKPDTFAKKNKANRYCFAETDSDLSEVIIYFDIDNNISDDTASLLTSVLFEGCGSKFASEMREIYAVTDDIFPSLIRFYGFSCLRISYTVKNNLLLKSLKLFFKLLKSSKKNISNAEYNSSIRFFTDNQLIDLDNPAKLNRDYALCDFVIGSLLSEPTAKKKNSAISQQMTC